jgi:hypothetical protein
MQVPGALPHGFMLFVHNPHKYIYIYIYIYTHTKMHPGAFCIANAQTLRLQLRS